MGFQTIKTLFGGYACVDPWHFREDQNASRVFLNKANSFRCPVGRSHGQAFLLMKGDKVEELSATVGTPLPLSFHIATTGKDSVKENKRVSELEFPGLYFRRAICISPGLKREDNYFLVEAVDRRFYFERWSSMNKCYNVISPTNSNESGPLTTNCYEDSLKEIPGEGEEDPSTFELWTWETMIQDIWDKVVVGLELNFEDTLTFDVADQYLPVQKPVNYLFQGVSAWSALHQVIDELGLVFVYNPVKDTYSIERPGKKQDWEDNVDANARIFAYDFIENPNNLIPEKFHVHVKRTWDHTGCEPDTGIQAGVDKSWVVNAVYSELITVADHYGDSEGDETLEPIEGSIEPLWLNIHTIQGANSTSGEPTDVASKAAAAIRNIVIKRLASQPNKVVYQGLFLGKEPKTGKPSAQVLPGTKIQCMVWRDYGEGLGICTEVMKSIGPMPTLEEPLSTATSQGGSPLILPQRKGGGTVLSLTQAEFSETLYHGHTMGGMIVPPSFAATSHREFTRETQLVRLVPATINTAAIAAFGEGDPDNVVSTGVGECIYKGIVVNYANPEASLDFSDFNYGESLGDLCWIVFHGATNSLMNFAPNGVGQVFMGKLVGVRNNLPVYAVSYHIQIGYGALDNAITTGGTSTGQLNPLSSGAGYDPDAKFWEPNWLPADRQYPAGSPGVVAIAQGDGAGNGWMIIAGGTVAYP